MNTRVTEMSAGEAEALDITAEQAAAPQARTPEQAAAPRPAAPQPQKKKRSSRRLLLMVSVPLVIAAVGGWFWLSGGRYVETDNAYVQQPMVSLSADVSGRVVAVLAHLNDRVKAGETLFKLDPEPYEIALRQADAALAAARVNVEQLRVAYATAQAQLKSAEETLTIRKAALDRKESLADQGLTAEAGLDDVKLAYQSAANAVALARQQVEGAAAALGGDPQIATDDHPSVRAALAAREAAARNLAKTTVVAPADGIVSQVGSLNVGQFVATGTTIASLVETGSTWIEANYKETQLAGIQAGMPVAVEIDAYPDVAFTGRVESIGAATGSEFALIPTQNATGNWVKITQRVPVRISVEGDGSHVLRAGMSAVVTVDTQPAKG
jgi:membrane fusion protein (multidrug efflux system)